MSRYWSDLARGLTPYVPGEQPQHRQLVKLNTNESPYPPSPRVLDAIRQVDGDSLRLYPDPESVALAEAIAGANDLAPDQVFLGNGSDEVLAHIFQALLKHDQPILYPDISYSFYPVWCGLYGIEAQPVALTEDFRVRVADYQQPNGGVIIPNPNAPTGIALSLTEIGALLESNTDSVVVIDEAYIDFGGQSACSLINQYDNLLVVQTLSKSRAMAGMRVGAAMGQNQLIEGLSRVKNSFNSYPLDVVAQHAALAAYEDVAYFRQCTDQVVASRERLSAALVQRGFSVLPSSANFLFATHSKRSAQSLFDGLREQGVIVRFFDKPRISDYLRISIGTDAQCDRLLEVIDELLA
ncbi:MAG: histidinol-phosphate transaminase [Halioglobus sp.]